MGMLDLLRSYGGMLPPSMGSGDLAFDPELGAVNPKQPLPPTSNALVGMAYGAGMLPKRLMDAAAASRSADMAPVTGDEGDIYRQSLDRALAFKNLVNTSNETAMTAAGIAAPAAEVGAAGALGGKLKPGAVAAAEEAPALAAPQQGISAYHGSPHDFDQFDLSKIGTGEGAQAYGHGLYFAENPKVAESYKGTVPNGLAWWNPKNFVTPAELPSGKGKMYEVNINAHPDEFLDWDKPLSEQHPQTQEAVKKAMGIDYYGKFDQAKSDKLWDQFKNANAGTAVRQGFIASDDSLVAQRLKDAGAPGIKYLDQGSRAKGEGSRNYVVFDPKIIAIMKKYGLAGMAPAAGAATTFGALGRPREEQ